MNTEMLPTPRLYTNSFQKTMVYYRWILKDGFRKKLGSKNYYYYVFVLALYMP